MVHRFARPRSAAALSVALACLLPAAGVPSSSAAAADLQFTGKARSRSDGRLLYVESHYVRAPGAVGDAKRLVNHVAGHRIDHALMEETARRIARARVSPEGQEGVNAFLEKRKPRWAE